MGVVVGIDLGTSNSVVAAMQDGTPTAIRDETGSSLIPSIVSFLPSGAVLVGSAAKERRSQDIKNTIYSVKRLIGRPWDSPEVRQARARFSFELREGPGRATFVSARNETFTLPEISAYVLRKVKSIAEIELGETVDRAVITVPANFNDLQRAATKVAGRVAGLEVLRILNEPTAAALAYGYNHGASEKIAVFDFGGGTFDITLLSLTENVFEVLATAGNTFLGGDDLDWAIAEKMADEFQAQHGRNIREYPSALEQLRSAAENLKVQLTQDAEVTETLELALEPKGATYPLSFSMSRAEFERLAAPIVSRTFDVCREALGVARMGIGNIDHVLLVGGCTKIPFIRQQVEDYFKRQVDAHLDPHEVVALGAALQAHALTTRTSTSRIEIPPVPQAKVQEPEVAPVNTEWRQKTQPFGRLGSTNIGVGPSRPDAPPPLQVPPPEEALSRPIPTTKHLGSRGRMNTAIGIGPTEDGGLPEDFLPIVSLEDQSDEADQIDDTWEDEETKVRTSPDASPEVDLPMALDELRKEEAAALADDVTVRVPRNKLESMAAHSLDESERRQSEFPTIPPPEEPDTDLPAVASTGASVLPGSRESRQPSSNPSADELRQRYGDLPLIIGGKRLGTRPPAERPASDRVAADELPAVKPATTRSMADTVDPDELPIVRPVGPRSGGARIDPGELPVIRPPLDTIVDATIPILPDDESLPVVRPSAANAGYVHDFNIHADLPLVGVGATERKATGYEAPAQQRPRPPNPGIREVG